MRRVLSLVTGAMVAVLVVLLYLMVLTRGSFLP